MTVEDAVEQAMLQNVADALWLHSQFMTRLGDQERPMHRPLPGALCPDGVEVTRGNM